MTDKKRQIEFYSNLLAKHGENYRALDWQSPANQELRYKIFTEIFIFGRLAKKLSVLDVGCGLGDLYAYLKKEKFLSQHGILYAGTDINPELLVAAQKKYPEADFSLVDILENYYNQFDYVFASGVFNIRTVDQESHLAFVAQMLEKMFELAKFGVAVNFLSEVGVSNSRLKDVNFGHYFYFSPEKIMSFCRNLTSRFILRHDYNLGDFTVYLLK